MSVAYGKGAKGKATRLHSLIVRARGACENCSGGNALQCAHIISRRYANTRTDERNAFCLCAACHRRFTEWPHEFVGFVVSKIGENGYAALRDKALAVDRKVDWDAECARLRAVAEGLGVTT